MAESGKDSAIAQYMAAARNVTKLSREEETELARRVRDSDDRRAAEALIKANLRYVAAIAVSYRRYGLRMSDLVSEGNLGLMMALRKYDPDRGVRFVTYAAYWSRAYILSFIIRSWSLVGGGGGPLRSKLFFKLRRERAMVANLVGEDDASSMTLLAERMGSTVEKTRSLVDRLDARDVSLDAAASADASTTLLEGLMDRAPSQEQQCMAAERQDALQAALKTAIENLDSRERFIVETRLLADEEASLAEIGRRLGVSRERARQLETRTKQKLRRHLEGLWEMFEGGMGAAMAT